VLGRALDRVVYCSAVCGGHGGYQGGAGSAVGEPQNIDEAKG